MIRKDSSVYIAEGARLCGDISLGSNSSIWYNAVLRGDFEPIHVGSGSNIQDNAMLHGSIGFPVHVGKSVTIGHGAIVHGCTIGDNTLIGMGSIILNGAVIGSNCIIGAGSLVTQNTRIPDNSLAFGNPAKIIRTLTQKNIESNRANAEEYMQAARKALEID